MTFTGQLGTASSYPGNIELGATPSSMNLQAVAVATTLTAALSRSVGKAVAVVATFTVGLATLFLSHLATVVFFVGKPLVKWTAKQPAVKWLTLHVRRKWDS